VVVVEVAAGVEPFVDEHPMVAARPNRQRTSAVIGANRLMLVILRVLSNEYECCPDMWPEFGHGAPIRLPEQPGKVNRQRATKGREKTVAASGKAALILGGIAPVARRGGACSIESSS